MVFKKWIWYLENVSIRTRTFSIIKFQNERLGFCHVEPALTSVGSQVLKWEVVSARKGILLFHVGIDIFVLAYEVSQML